MGVVMTLEDKTVSGGRIAESKFLRILMILLSVALLFIGPTYIPYLMTDALKIGLIVSDVTGLVLFLIGAVMLGILIRKKVIT